MVSAVLSSIASELAHLHVFNVGEKEAKKKERGKLMVKYIFSERLSTEQGKITYADEAKE